MVPEMRVQVVTECVQNVAATVGECSEREINPVVSRLIGEVKQDNYDVDVNISAKMIKVIHKNRLILRHPFTFFSFGAQGKDPETEKMFGYIAKNKDGGDRRCHVFKSKEVQKFMDVLTAAINVSTNDARASPASNDGFAAPAVPLRSRHNQNRLSFVSNVRNVGSVMEDVRRQQWYHGNLSRADAESLLTAPGDFLVRQSDHTPGQFVLSGITGDNDHKHLILLDHHQRVRTRDRQFNNISELIDYHMNNGMAVHSDGKDRETSLSLIRPVPHS
uniref:SH2 domain-containing protein n=1 Tax=Caenorhabditis japonica TaxID=281687 RepID=A0A8R1DGA3_CAEJA